MTAKIIQFSTSRDKKLNIKKPPIEVDEKTNLDIFRDVMEDVLGEWQAAATRDRLNQYIHLKIPSRVRGKAGSDYIGNLNLLSRVEIKLNMKVAIFYPACMSNSQVGWLVGFHRGTDVFATPPDMASEGHARAMNIVLFIVFESILKTLNRS